jgi:hypothetical protein
MRGFMRAIGLGGLFRKSGGGSMHRASRSLSRAGANFRVITLEEFQSATLTFGARPASTSNASSRRSSSSNERPQFLFFCGTEATGPSPEWSSTIADRLTSMSFPTPAQPVISHRMPVFFAPVAPSVTTSMSPSGRPRPSIFAN